jgi:hypothetical protein
MNLTRIAILCGLGLLLQGCAAAGLAVVGAGAGVGMGAGVEHSMNGVAYKTFTAPVNNVRFATLKSLDRMGMPLSTDQKTDTGWKMIATATERTIEIELETLTPSTTRMRVVANKGDIFFKDSSTATEIILQTAQILQDEPAATKPTAEKNGKRRTS